MICRYNDPDIESYAKEHPFQLAPINSSLSEYSEIGFDVSENGESSNSEPLLISPENVGTSILKHLLKITADFLGHSQVNKAVIAVPAKFTGPQRAATAEAFKRAGLKVVRVMEEPTAAAVAYDLHKKKEVHQILVYDFGGGTLDVSLLYVAKESVQVYATDGDDMLGGSDFDICVNHYLNRQIENIIVNNLDIPKGTGITNAMCDDQSFIRKGAEELKKQLSFSETAIFQCFSKSTEKYIDIKVTRSEFEVACADIFERAMVPVERLLVDLGMKEEEVDEVVLVGGTTRIPKVKAQLKSFFKQEVNDRIDPDVTVAYGAASIVD